jgi:hypothetical protein
MTIDIAELCIGVILVPGELVPDLLRLSHRSRRNRCAVVCRRSRLSRRKDTILPVPHRRGIERWAV